MSPEPHILVVNDDPLVLRIIQRLLEPVTGHISTAMTGLDCLSSIKHREPDLILLDRMLPDIEGTEICRQIKSDPQTAHIFVLIVSAEKRSSDHQATGLEIGADDYIAWPADRREFLARVQAMLRIRQAEEDLRKSREQYRRIVETALEGVWLLDDRGKTTFVNQRMADMIGYDVSEMTGQPFCDFLEESPTGPTTDACLHCMSGTNRRYDYRFRRKDGSVIWAMVSTTRFSGDGEQENACLIMVTDITELKQAEQDREKLISELQESLAQVKTLTGLLPICMSCKKVRDDRGYWSEVEKYLHEHADVLFSHGYCPECAKKLYPEYFDDEEENIPDQAQRTS